MGFWNGIEGLGGSYSEDIVSSGFKVLTLLIRLDKIFCNVYKEKMIDIVFGMIVNLRYGENPVQKHVKLLCK